MLSLWAGAASAHLDPAWQAGRHPAIRLRRWAPISAGIAAVLLVFALGIGFLAWQDWKGNMGPPLPLSGGIFGVALSPDGRTAVTISANLEMWDVADRAHPRRLAYTKGDIAIGADPAFSPDGRVLATAGGGGGILWNVADPARPAKIVDLPGPGGVGAVQFSPGGRILASSYGGTVALWNIADPARAARIATLTRQDGDVSALSFSPDGHLLASVSERGTVVLWNIADPARVTPLATLTIPPPAIPNQPGPDVAASFSPDGHLLASASDGGTVVLWNIADPATRPGPPRSTPPSPAAGPGPGTSPDVALAFSADDHTLTMVEDSITVTQWNVTAPGAVARLTTSTLSSIGGGPVAFSTDGRTLAGARTTGDTAGLSALP